MSCPDANDLVAYTDGALAGASLRAIDDHLDACAQCRSIVADLLGSRRVPERAAVRPGDRVGRFVVTEPLGAGGMGVVFRAHDPELDRDVALKLVRAERTLRHDAEHRLALEAQAIARTSHPNIVAVFAVGRLGPDVYVAMELVRGRTLRAWLREERPDPRRIIEVFIEAGRGLAAAHEAGVIHRDFKPDNVMLSHDGQVKVLDFGLAQLGDASTTEPEQHDSTSGDARLTETGTVMGTVAYMAPEQHDGGLVDARADQYAFAVALWEALTGELPFPSVAATQARASKHAGPPPPAPKLPRRMIAPLRRALAPEPDERFPSMTALLERLMPPASRRRVLAVAGVGTCAAVLAWMSLAPDEPDCRASERAETAWGQPRRDALLQAFARSELGEASRERAIARMDDRVRALVDVHADVCKRIVAGEIDDAEAQAQRTCLDARWSEFSVLTEAWTEATSAQLADVPVVVAGLDDPHDCVDPAPRSVDARGPLGDAILVELANVHALVKVGRFDQAAAALAELRPRAEQIGDPAVTARVVREIGTLHGIRDESADAERELSLVYELALGSGDDRLATDVAVELVRVVGFGLSRVDDARRWARSAQALIERTHDRTAAAWLEQQLGLLCQLEFDGAGALQHHQRAFTELLDVEGYHDIRTVLAMAELGNAARMLDDHELAAEYASEAYEMARDVAGPEHAITVQLLGNRGFSRLRVGDTNGATEDLERSAEGVLRVFGPRHPGYGASLHMLAEATWEAGDQERWLELAERTLVIATEAFGEDHLHVAEVELELGERLLVMDRRLEACGHLSRAVPVLERLGGEPAVLIAADAYVALAGCRIATGEQQAALGALQRAEPLLERAAPTADPLELAEVAFAWTELAASVGVDNERIDAIMRRARTQLVDAGEIGLPF